jgi:anti-sigma regulatory factor (Ser/Thr protein kinase)
VTKTFVAKADELANVVDFVEGELDKYECNQKLKTSICVAIEEVFVNVAHYAYPDTEGGVDVSVAYDNATREVTFEIVDSGVPFDPLKKPDPDVSLPAEEREIGGLGIFIAKKTMDSITYVYENAKNKLTMTKKI